MGIAAAICGMLCIGFLLDAFSGSDDNEYTEGDPYEGELPADPGPWEEESIAVQPMETGGTDADDQIAGTDLDDVVSALLGNDEVSGGGGNDYIDGNEGDDTLNGQEGDDELRGGDGNDVVYGEGGSDTANGGLGEDTIFGGAGNDVLVGVVTEAIGGPDTDQGDTLYGDIGNDELILGTGDEGIGGDGDDTFVLGTWTTGSSSIITDYVAAEDQILIEYDDAAVPNPDVTVATVTDGPNTFSAISLNGQEIGRVLVNAGEPALTPADIGLVPVSYGDSGDDYVLGTSAAEHIIGRQGDDTIIGGGGADTLEGWAGDDEIISYGSGGILSGNNGDDYLEAMKTSYGQYHLYGGDGDDTFVMHLDNNPGWGHQAFHAYGGDGADEFRFVGVGSTNAPMVSRIDDFDASQDSIWVDDTQIDLSALPDNMRVLDYYDQQWLVIDDNVMIGLEGVRNPAPAGVPTMMGSAEEMHFHRFPTNLADLPTVEFIDR